MYNAARFIAEAIDSVLRQTWTDFELIVVDDGSTDASATIARERGSRDARVRVISRPNTGVCGARNDALAASRGRYMACLDADDVATPDRLEQQVRFLDGHPGCVLVGSWVTITDPRGVPLAVEKLPTTHEEIDARLLKGDGGVVRQPTVMLRREAVVAAGGYDPGYAASEDLDLFLRLAERGQLANLPRPLVNYRQHFASTNRTLYLAQNVERRRAVEDAFRRRFGSVPASLELPEYFMPSVAEQSRDWAWALLKRGNVSAARKHAVQAVRHEPLSIESWRALACAVRGR
jgi:glycosyltransferase involved in cell wall biosynthesis